jgi:glutaconate CoA-transferase subunit A
LREAVAELVRDGDTVALEGFTHLIPTAGAHEIIRHQRRDLVLIRMTPDLIYDQMIGMGCASKLVFSWGGNPGVGSLLRFRDAIEHGWSEPLQIEEHSHAGMANRYVAGASHLPFAVLRGYVGTDLPKVTKTIVPITWLFSGEELMAVPALNPDVSIIHAQQADRRGNVAIWGIVGIQKEAVMAAKRAIVTVEEVVDELEPHPLPGRPSLGRGRRDLGGPERCTSVLRRRLLRPRQRLLRGVGPRQPRPRGVSGVDGAPRPWDGGLRRSPAEVRRGGGTVTDTEGNANSYAADEMMTVAASASSETGRSASWV